MLNQGVRMKQYTSNYNSIKANSQRELTTRKGYCFKLIATKNPVLKGIKSKLMQFDCIMVMKLKP